MEYFMIYLLVMADNFQAAAGVMSAICGVLWLFLGCPIAASIHELDEKDRPPKVIIKVFKGLTCAVILLAAVATLMPNTKQLAIIIGGGAVVEAVTSEKGKEFTGRIGTKLEEKLYEILSIEEEKE